MEASVNLPAKSDGKPPEGPIGSVPVLPPPITDITMPILPDEPADVAFDRLCKLHQGSANQQFCQVCHKMFPNWYKLKQHLHGHADFRPYTCTYCDKTFRNYSKKSRHEKTHSGVKPYVCKICNKHVSRSEHLKRHLLTHTESHPYKCVLCEYRSRRLDCIRYHMKNKHPEKENPQMMFNTTLVEVNDDHPNDACDLLWQQYKEAAPGMELPPKQQPEASPKPKRKKKKKSSNPAIFPDNQMPTYSMVSNLPPPTPQFPMPVQINNSTGSVSQGFAGFTPLTHAPTLPSQQEVKTVSSASTSKMDMNHSNCEQKFDSSFSDGEGPNKYFFVSKANTQPQNQTTTQQAGAMELPKNMCGICEKWFDCPSKLQRHQNTHAGIRPYKCEFCNKQLSRPEHLKRHVLTHDPDKQNKPKNWKSKSAKAASTTGTNSSTMASIVKAVSMAMSTTTTDPMDSAPSTQIQTSSKSSCDMANATVTTKAQRSLTMTVKQENGQSKHSDCQMQYKSSPSRAEVKTEITSIQPVRASNTNNSAIPTSWNQQVSMATPVTSMNNPPINLAMMANVAMRTPPQPTQLSHPTNIINTSGYGTADPLAMLHTYTTFGNVQNPSMPMSEMHVYRTANPALPSNIHLVGQNPGVQPCSLPVFPPISDMR